MIHLALRCRRYTDLLVLRATFFFICKRMAWFQFQAPPATTIRLAGMNRRLTLTLLKILEKVGIRIESSNEILSNAF